mgnify:CR=1 FL=1
MNRPTRKQLIAALQNAVDMLDRVKCDEECGEWKKMWNRHIRANKAVLKAAKESK